MDHETKPYPQVLAETSQTKTAKSLPAPQQLLNNNTLNENKWISKWKVHPITTSAVRGKAPTVFQVLASGRVKATRHSAWLVPT